MAFIQTAAPEHFDYADYGDHLTTHDDEYYSHRVDHVSLPKRMLFRFISKRYGVDARILDFGGGAGFFVRSCINFGFRNAFLVEPSQKLRQVATKRLGLDPATVSGDMREFGVPFDVVAMLDVIEHLPVDVFDDIMNGIVRQMKPGGILLGTTPNLNSLNIAICGVRDPVIAPPQHTVYFTRRSLDSYLRKLGLRRKMLLVTGFSTNSFFRTRKFSPSWVEQPTSAQRLPALGIRLGFTAIGGLLTPLGNGYGMYFVYEKPADG